MDTVASNIQKLTCAEWEVACEKLIKRGQGSGYSGKKEPWYHYSYPQFLQLFKDHYSDKSDYAIALKSACVGAWVPHIQEKSPTREEGECIYQVLETSGQQNESGLC